MKLSDEKGPAPPDQQAVVADEDSGAAAADRRLPGAADLQWQGMPSLLAPELIARLTRPAPGRAIACVASDWGTMVAAASLGLWLREAWLWPLLWMCIGSRLHALGILAHDGAHGLLLPHRKANDCVVELFLAWPLFLSPASYRALHRGHHRFLNTGADPDWVRNRPDELASSSLLQFLQVMLGVSPRQAALVHMIRPSSRASHSPSPGSSVPPLRYVVLVVVVAGVAWMGVWREALLVWAAPFFLWFLPTMRLKGIAEHFAVANTSPLTAARTVLAGPWERYFLAPHNVHFHLEHHLFPSIPCTRLPEAHQALSAVPAFRTAAHVTGGYVAFLGECLAFRAHVRSSVTAEKDNDKADPVNAA
jgi:fatty acid desaturase